MFTLCCYGDVNVYVMKMAKLPSPMLASVTMCNDKIVELIELGGLGYLTQDSAITGSAVALHCIKAHRQSQWRSPKFDPL